jgi:UDP-3-O-[3-hydroxymyristoyl] glucosamine N-acyltransferase
VPAKPLKQDLKEKAAIHKLPESQKKLKMLEKEIAAIKSQLAEKK